VPWPRAAWQSAHMSTVNRPSTLLKGPSVELQRSSASPRALSDRMCVRLMVSGGLGRWRLGGLSTGWGGQVLAVGDRGDCILGMSLACSMVWPTSPGAMACSRSVSCHLDAPAGQRQISCWGRCCREARLGDLVARSLLADNKL
jgi:hypothetical protein